MLTPLWQHVDAGTARDSNRPPLIPASRSFLYFTVVPRFTLDIRDSGNPHMRRPRRNALQHSSLCEMERPNNFCWRKCRMYNYLQKCCRYHHGPLLWRWRRSPAQAVSHRESPKYFQLRLLFLIEIPPRPFFIKAILFHWFPEETLPSHHLFYEHPAC